MTEVHLQAGESPPAVPAIPRTGDEILMAFASPVPQRRVTVAFRILLAIPQVFVLWVLTIAAGRTARDRPAGVRAGAASSGLAAGPQAWRLVLSSAAKRLVILYIAVGAVVLVGSSVFTGIAASHSANSAEVG